ncbi:hypothetical protein KL920_002089 [Ogataea angusta]|nr:hypothetical protein KL920_002089 [Ogataea angusta]KAG7847928.1 hypothetical protein KL941_002107 [Ogataea angusta]
MTVPFPDIDPYAELGCKPEDAPPSIKKAYYKLCLKFHPDKLSEQDQKKYKTKFEKIQFSYQVLGDPKRRERYDKTGNLDESVADDDDFDWYAFFQEMRESDVKVTAELIEKDKKSYQGSEEEYQDVLETMIYYEGEFLRLFETIPHLEFSKEEEDRMFKLVQQMVADGTLKNYKSWKTYAKNRTSEMKKMFRQLKKESKEAEEALKEINEKNELKLNGSEDSLRQLIQSKKSHTFDDLIAKYSKQSKKQSKRSKNSEYDLDDEEFTKIQKKMKKQRHS